MTLRLSEEKLADALENAKHQVEVGGFYSHFRDPSSRYLVKELAIIEATQEVGVVYQKLTGSKTLQSFSWVRPISSWLELVEFGNTSVPRFHKVAN